MNCDNYTFLLFQVSVVKDLLRFAQVFSQMIHIGIELPLDQVPIPIGYKYKKY